jgi:hypothetical protein
VTKRSRCVYQEVYTVSQLIIAAFAISLTMNAYLLCQNLVLSRCHAWGLRTQGAWRWRLPVAALLSRIWPVDVVHLDIDRLKILNSTLGEARVNALLHVALRRDDIYRLQHGDELVAVVRAGRGLAVAEAIGGCTRCRSRRPSWRRWASRSPRPPWS